MSLKNRIKESIGRLITDIWSLPVRKPSGKMVDLENDNNLLLFSYSSKEELDVIIAMIKKAKKALNHCMVLVFSEEDDNRIAKPDDNLLQVSLKDFNLFGKGKRRLNNWLKDNNFHIFISFVDNSNLFCDKIISGISSDFKAGIYDEDNLDLFDLTIKQKTKDYNKQLELFIHYIKTLNINK